MRKLERLVEILLIEDNPADVRLMVEALKDARVITRMTVAKDGVEAFDILRRERKCPDLILLDLNLPKMGGREVLQTIKTDPDLKRTPVVVITTSRAEEDIIKSYDLHANCYITKPVSLDQLVRVVRAIEDFWLTIVELPSR
jgi:CheY-like chemotaxis protein